MDIRLPFWFWPIVWSCSRPITWRGIYTCLYGVHSSLILCIYVWQIYLLVLRCHHFFALAPFTWHRKGNWGLIQSRICCFGKLSIEPKAYVHTLSEIHHKNSGIVTRSFVGEAGFVASLDKACREFVNRNAVTGTLSTRSSELIAMYADMLLRKDIKMAEDDLEGALNRVVCSSKLISFSLSLTIGSQMVLFKYLEDKDMFQTFYTTKLSKHLVHGSWCVHIGRWGREHDFQVEGGL